MDQLSKHLDKVTELRFGKNVKLVRRPAFRKRPGGWMLLVEGIAGGHAMNFCDGFLYHTISKDADVFGKAEFFSDSVDDAILCAEALHNNLQDRSVVDPSSGFMSRFLNPSDVEGLLKYWGEQGIERTAK